MLNSETLNPHRLGFTYNLKGRDEACASFIKTETNEIFDCNFSNYGSDIRALSNAILRLINVNDIAKD